jgi:hypothetical protein
MLINRGEINRVLENPQASPWWQDRVHPWAHMWSRRAMHSRIGVSLSRAAVLSIAGQRCAMTAELRWKAFLLRASPLIGHPVGRGELN